MPKDNNHQNLDLEELKQGNLKEAISNGLEDYTVEDHKRKHLQKREIDDINHLIQKQLQLYIFFICKWGLPHSTPHFFYLSFRRNDGRE